MKFDLFAVIKLHQLETVRMASYQTLIRSKNGESIIQPRECLRRSLLRLINNYLNYSDMDTLTHLLKASLGTGILAMPMAFSYAGLVTGIFATILTAIICTHVSESRLSICNLY